MLSTGVQKDRSYHVICCRGAMGPWQRDVLQGVGSENTGCSSSCGC